MKVLFVYMNTASRGAFPIGLTNLASYLEVLGHEIRIFDTTFYKEFSPRKREVTKKDYGFYKPVENPAPGKHIGTDLFSDLNSLVAQLRPDIIGFSILSSHFYAAVELADRLKENYADIPIIFGGLHPSIMPEDTLAVNSVDMICVGEGEYAMAELLERLSERRDIKNVNNIWLKEDGRIYRNEIRKLVDINELPVLNWSLFSEQHCYAALNGRTYRMGSVEFSRGCPFSCNYCSCTYLRNLTGSQKYLRRKSIEKSISDLVFLKNKYDLEMFYFLDESFLSMPFETLRMFSQEYKSEVNLPFHVMTHPASVSREKTKLLESMGCYLATIGIECGNQEFRKQVLNRNVPNNKIIEAFETMRADGILASAFGMIGLPYETRSMIFETIEMFRRCKPETYAVGIFKPFLGSKLRQTCIDEGFFDSANDNYNYPDTTSVLRMPQLSAEEIEGLYKTFFLYTKLAKKHFPLLNGAERDESKLEHALEIYRQEELPGL